MIAYEAEQQYHEIEREKVHQKNIIAAEEKAKKLLESAEIEANMSSQQKLAKLMQQEDKESEVRGESPGFIRSFTNRQEVRQEAMIQRAVSMIPSGPAVTFNQVPNKINPE